MLSAGGERGRVHPGDHRLPAEALLGGGHPGLHRPRVSLAGGRCCAGSGLTTAVVPSPPSNGLLPLMQFFLLLGVLQKVPDSRQQKSGGKAGSLCVSEVQSCSELAASSPSPAPRRLGQAEAGDPGTQPSPREALNTHPLKLFYYTRAVFYAFFPTPASVVYLRFCWLNRFIYVSVTVALTLSLESQQLCQNFSSALGYAVGRFACPSAGSASPGPPQAGSAQALPGLRGNPSTALLGTVLGKQGARACRGENLAQAWNRGLERLQLPPGLPLPPHTEETRFECRRVGHGGG